MFYDEVKITTIKSSDDYAQAHEVMVEEFPDHRDTNIVSEYEWLLIAKKSNTVLGVITANRYIPNKALLCDIVVKKEYRSKGVGIKLLKEMGIHIREQGYTHLLGFTPKKSKDALNTYKRVHTKQEEMIVTTSELNISIPHIEQMEMILKARESRKKNNKDKGN